MSSSDLLGRSPEGIAREVNERVDNPKFAHQK